MCNGMFNLDNQPASDLSFLGIVARFELRGEDATADNAAKIRATISKHCNAVFSGIGLVTLVTVDVGDPATPVAPDRGVIELFRTPADGRSTIERFGPGMPPERKIVMNLNDWDVNWTPAHEFGHYIGLDDQ